MPMDLSLHALPLPADGTAAAPSAGASARPAIVTGAAV